MTEDELKTFTLLAVKLMVEAAKEGRSMAAILVDPREVLGIRTPHPDGAGKMFIAVAGGPSVQKLQTALALAANPQ